MRSSDGRTRHATCSTNASRQRQPTCVAPNRSGSPGSVVAISLKNERPRPGRRRCARSLWPANGRRAAPRRPSGTCSERWRRGPTRWISKGRARTTAARWLSPRSSVCARSSPTATLVLAGYSFARESSTRPRPTLRRPPRCTARWAWPTGGRRRSPRRARAFPSRRAESEPARSSNVVRVRDQRRIEIRILRLQRKLSVPLVDRRVDRGKRLLERLHGGLDRLVRDRSAVLTEAPVTVARERVDGAELPDRRRDVRQDFEDGLGFPWSLADEAGHVRGEGHVVPLREIHRRVLGPAREDDRGEHGDELLDGRDPIGKAPDVAAARRGQLAGPALDLGILRHLRVAREVDLDVLADEGLDRVPDGQGIGTVEERAVQHAGVHPLGDLGDRTELAEIQGPVRVPDDVEREL